MICTFCLEWGGDREGGVRPHYRDTSPVTVLSPGPEPRHADTVRTQIGDSDADS